MRAVLIPALAVLAASCATSETDTAEIGPELRAEIAGRVAGPPRACVPQRDLASNRTVDNGDAIIFGARGGDLIYVNRPKGGCPSLRFGRTLVTRTTSGSLCSGEIVSVVDLQSDFQQGSCGLGEFVPYRRTR